MGMLDDILEDLKKGYEQLSQTPTNIYEVPRTPEQQQRELNTLKAAPARVLTGGAETANMIGQFIDMRSHPKKNEDGSDRGFWERFSDAQYGPDPEVARKVVAERIRLTQERQAAGDKREFVEIYDDVGKDPKFKEFEAPHIPVIRRYTDKAAEAIDNYYGAPLDIDKTTDEKIATVVTQALVPTTIINKVLKNAPAAARWVGDMALPGTSHYTPGGITANAGIGAAVTAGADAYLGNENNEPPVPPPTADMPQTAPLPPRRPITVTGVEEDDDETTDPHTISTKFSELAAKIPPVNDAAIAAFGIAAALGGRGAAKQAAAKAAARTAANAAASAAGQTAVQKGAKTRARRTGLSAGPPHVVPETRNPTIKSRGAETAPGRAALLHMTQNRAATNAKVNAWSQHARSNVTSAVEAWRTGGLVENVPDKVISGRQLRLVEDALMNTGELEGFLNWKHSLTTYERRGHDITSVENKINQNLQAQATATKASNYRKLSNLRAKHSELTKKLALHKSDDPSTRTTWAEMSSNEMKQIIADGNANKKWMDLDKRLVQRTSVDQLRFAVRNGLLEKSIAKSYKDMHLHHVFLHDDPHGDTKGLSRMGSKLRDKFRVNENPFGDDDSFASSLAPVKHRSREGNIGKPINVFDAIDLSWENLIRYDNRNKYKINVLNDLIEAQDEALKAGRITDPVIIPFKHQGRTEFSLKHIQALIKADVFDPKEWIHTLENGKYKFHKSPRDPLLAGMLNQAPAFSTPVMRDMSKFWRTMTTGKGNPGFMERNMIMETHGFKAIRPWGTRYGTDYLIDKAMQMTPKGFQNALAPFKEPFLSGVVRPLTTVIDPAAYLMNLGQAVHLWAKQNDAWIARSITEGLESDRGFFAALGRTPGGRKYLEGLASNAHKSFENSLVYTLFQNRATDLAVMRGMSIRKREMDVFFDTRLPRWARYVSSPVHFAVQQYTFMVNAMQEAARVGYAYRNWESIRAADGSIDPKLARKLYADVRTTSSGDLTKLPAGKFMQHTVSIMPYTNVMMRSVQNFGERLMEDPKMMSAFVAGVGTPAIYSMYLMNNWDKKAYDYYNHELPLWKKGMEIILPTHETIWKWANGEQVPFSKEAVYVTQLLPEYRPIVNAITTFMAGLGMFGNKFGVGQRDPLTGGLTVPSVLETMGQSLKDTFAPVPPMILTALGKAAGVAIEPGNLFMGPAAIANKVATGDLNDSRYTWNPLDPSTSAASSRVGGATPMHLSSEIPQVANDIMTALFGTMTGRLMQAYSTGETIYRDTKKLDEALYGAVKEVTQRTFEIPEDVPLIREGHDRVYRRNPVNTQSQATKKFIGLVTGPDKGAIRQDTGEDLLDTIAESVRDFSKDPTYKDFREAYNDNDSGYKGADDNRFMDYNEREAEKSKFQRAMNKNDMQQGKFLIDMRKELQELWGKEYEAEYKEPFTLENWARRLRAADDKRKAAEAKERAGEPPTVLE